MADNWEVSWLLVNSFLSIKTSTLGKYHSTQQSVEHINIIGKDSCPEWFKPLNLLFKLSLVWVLAKAVVVQVYYLFDLSIYNINNDIIRQNIGPVLAPLSLSSALNPVNSHHNRSTNKQEIHYQLSDVSLQWCSTSGCSLSYLPHIQQCN